MLYKVFVHDSVSDSKHFLFLFLTLECLRFPPLPPAFGDDFESAFEDHPVASGSLVVVWVLGCCTRTPWGLVVSVWRWRRWEGGVVALMRYRHKAGEGGPWDGYAHVAPAVVTRYTPSDPVAAKVNDARHETGARLGVGCP